MVSYYIPTLFAYLSFYKPYTYWTLCFFLQSRYKSIVKTLLLFEQALWRHRFCLSKLILFLTSMFHSVKQFYSCIEDKGWHEIRHLVSRCKRRNEFKTAHCQNTRQALNFYRFSSPWVSKSSSKAPPLFLICHF